MAYKKSNSNGQATMANSEPVVIASDQSAVPVSATNLDIRDLTAADVVTANLSATDNAVLDAIAASVAAIDTDTSTIIGHVDGIETLLTTIEADTSAIQTAVQLIDNAIAGSEMQVDVVAPLPAGTNNIGDVDVLSLVPGTAATNLGKARDSAIGATDTGVAMLGVRRDTPTAETPAAGDYVVPQISSNGEQWVRLAGEAADDAAFTLGTTRVLPNGAVAVAMDGTDPTAVSAEGDYTALRSDPNRILLINQTHPRFFRASVDYASAQTNATVQAAPGASLSLYITDIIVSNGATAGNITLLDGSGGSVVFEIYPAINGGVAHSFRNPIKLTANTLLAITSTTVTTHSVTVTGYIAA